MDFIPTALCEKKLLVLKLQWPSLSTSPLSEVMLSGYSSFSICLFFRVCCEGGSREEGWGEITLVIKCLDFPGGSDGKNVCLQCRKPEFDPWVGKIPWRRKWQPTLVLLPGKSHGWSSLVGYSPRGCKEWDATERLHFLSFTV